MTRRMTTLKWVFYALWTLVFLLVHLVVSRDHRRFDRR